jgi:hypothetical protein
MPKNKLQKSKDRAAEIKLLLQDAEESSICNERIDILKNEQYQLSRQM